MVMTRNGLASAGQLLVSDITSFTLPDTIGSPTPANFTNVFARYRAMAIGTGVTAAASTNTGLEAEITTGGGGRRSDADVDTFLSGTNDEQANWETTWTFTLPFSISEVVVGNATTANTGVHLLRQVFSSPLDVVATDLLKLTVTVTNTGSNNPGTPGVTAGGLMTHRGLREAARLLMHPSTNRLGAGGGAGDWETDGVYVASAKFDEIAIGTDNGTTLAMSQTNTALGAEAATNGGSRRTGADVTGELMSDPPGFASSTFTNFTGDTVQWRTTFTFTGALSIGEQGVFNGATTDIILLRQTYAANLDFVATDKFTPIVRVVTQ